MRQVLHGLGVDPVVALTVVLLSVAAPAVALVLVATRSARPAAHLRAVALVLLVAWPATVGFVVFAPGYPVADVPVTRLPVDIDDGVSVLNLVGNVALFAPLGAAIALGRLVPARLRRAPSVVGFAALSGSVIAAGIEISQGAVGRIGAADDVLLNALGATAGALIGHLLRHATLRRTSHRTVRPDLTR